MKANVDLSKHWHILPSCWKNHHIDTNCSSRTWKIFFLSFSKIFCLQQNNKIDTRYMKLMSAWRDWSLFAWYLYHVPAGTNCLLRPTILESILSLSQTTSKSTSSSNALFLKFFFLCFIFIHAFNKYLKSAHNVPNWCRTLGYGSEQNRPKF